MCCRGSVSNRFIIYQRCKLMNLNYFSFIFPEIILKVLLFLIMQSKFHSNDQNILHLTKFNVWNGNIILFTNSMSHEIYAVQQPLILEKMSFRSIQLRIPLTESVSVATIQWKYLHRNDRKCCISSSTDWHLISFQFIHFVHNFGLWAKIEEQRS